MAETYPHTSSNNSHTFERGGAATAAETTTVTADDSKQLISSTDSTQPLPPPPPPPRPQSPSRAPQKGLDPEVSRSAAAALAGQGGKAWRQLQEDSEQLRWHSVMVVSKVGGGPVSTVYLAKDLRHTDDLGQPVQVAVRVMDWSCVLGDYQRSVYHRLVRTYEAMPPHPNIVRVLRRIEEVNTNFLIQEWCCLGSLRSALAPSGCFARGMAEGTARGLLLQVCNGLQFLHQQNLPHGRLTSSNILLAKEFTVKLSDYGFPASSCSNCTDDDTHLRYRAPELLRGQPFSLFAADVWSVGIVLYEMLHVSLPYGPRDIANAERMINMPPLQCRSSLSFSGVMLLKRLLTFNPRFRPSLQTVISDPWLLEKSKKSDKYHPQCYQDHLRYTARLL